MTRKLIEYQEEIIMDKHIHTPITEEITADLKAGDYVYITGTLYVARDAAHKRMMEVLDEGKELPIEIKTVPFITWDHPRQEKDARSVPQVQLPQAVWINMLRVCWIWGKKP